MTHPSFAKAESAFSKILCRIPQDNLPADLVREVVKLLDSLRSDPVQMTFAIPEDRQFLAHESNLAFGLVSLWRQRWTQQNPEKALWISAHMTQVGETANVHKALDYEDECDMFTAAQMALLLKDQHQRIPRELEVFLKLGWSGSKEKE